MNRLLNNSFRYIKTLVFILIACAVLSCHIEPKDAYSLHINKMRLSKDSFLKWSNESPLEESQRKSFIELAYYAPDTNYRIIATVQKSDLPDTISMEDTKGDNMRVIRYAKLHFSLHGRPFTLSAFKQLKLLKDPLSSEMVFVPFYDSTNGDETHAGGRYLDIDYKGGASMALDFNLAYNPYCAYSPDFSCPIPPKENRLAVSIRAGEKEYK